MSIRGEEERKPQPLAPRALAPRPAPGGLRPVPAPRQGLSFTLHRSFAAAEAEWRRFEIEAVGTGFQSFDWLAQWHAHAGGDVEPAILIVALGRVPVMLAPFGIERRLGARCLVWLGGRLADYKGPLVARDIGTRLPTGRFAALWPKIVKALPRHDVVLLENQPELLGDLPNPFIALGGDEASDPAFVFPLPASYDEFITRFRPETRRNDRVKERKLGELGALDFRIAATPEEARALAREILDRKAEQLRAQGVASIFAEETYRAAYLALAGLRAEHDLLHLQVAALTLDGHMISGSIAHVWHGRATLMVHVYDHAYAKSSPGRLHLLKLVRASIEAGHTAYDLSVGRAAYKESFCDTPMRLFNLVEAATPWGLASAGALTTGLGLKRVIKTNERLMGLVRGARAALARR